MHTFFEFLPGLCMGNHGTKALFMTAHMVWQDLETWINLTALVEGVVVTDGRCWGWRKVKQTEREDDFYLHNEHKEIGKVVQVPWFFLSILPAFCYLVSNIGSSCAPFLLSEINIYIPRWLAIFPWWEQLQFSVLCGRPTIDFIFVWNCVHTLSKSVHFYCLHFIDQPFLNHFHP